MRASRRLRLLGVALALALIPRAAGAADPLTDQRSKVRTAQDRIASLRERLAGLLRELDSLEGATASTSAQLGLTTIRLQRAEQRAVEARAAFNARAREAYKRAGWREAQMLLGVRTFPQMLSFGQFVGSAIESDRAAHRSLVRSLEDLRQQRAGIAFQKQDLLAATNRTEALRTSIREALSSGEAVLTGAREELARLEAERRALAGRSVSPQVEARRAARQVELDRKLAETVAWYAPGFGPEPYLPPQLRSAGIVTTGAASWYGPGFDGRRASSGATYRMAQLTAASLVLPFGTFLKVTLAERSVVVVITDRGPYVPGRVLDLSAAGAEAVGLSGVKEVRMEVLVPNEPAPPFP